ncbi:MAG: prolyl oligopeptidase family serine peptidase [Bryobacteraceae bacterium]
MHASSIANIFRNPARLALFLPILLTAAERPVPPPGVAVPAETQSRFEAGLAEMRTVLAAAAKRRGVTQLDLADVRIFHEAVRYALQYNEFLRPEELATGQRLLDAGLARARQLREGLKPWAEQTGLVVRGYVSKIDGSVQPYGLVVPPTWSPTAPGRWRLDAWFHGRNERLTELNFLDDRMKNEGQFTPPDTIVLHLYGRYCNANKFAGEIDLFEALDAVKQHYRIDPDRISVRGFSMGGAAAWHIAAHYAGLWASAAPGAGFAETAEFLQVFQKETVQPTWWEKKLWHMYDATDYAENFFNLPLVAYSGEKDRQIQAAKVMERELAKAGMTMRHVIGPGTEHRYHPDSKIIIDSALNSIVARGRNAVPKELKFVTYTLRYNRLKWLRVDSLARHWEKGRVDASISDDREIRIQTANVTGLSLLFAPGECPLNPMGGATVVVDGQPVAVPGPQTDASWRTRLRKTGGKWTAAGAPQSGLHKSHGLQGPVDDAFLSRFIIVKPGAKSRSAAVETWVHAEMDRAIAEWRRHFRGEAIVKMDSEITPEDARSSNLILWGDPDSNAYLAGIAARLPVSWSGGNLTIGRSKPVSASGHAAILIYPNPAAPNRYVVLNSGFTFREYDYLNNARQISKLPDWAIVDLAVQPDSRWPGRIADAGFFGEHWEWLQP